MALESGRFTAHIRIMADKQPKRPNNNANALESWESEGGAPASDDGSIKRKRGGKARAAKMTLEERKGFGSKSYSGLPVAPRAYTRAICLKNGRAGPSEAPNRSAPSGA